MEIALEISFYPLQEDYLAGIRAFIARLRAEPGVRVESSSMSTHIVGDYERVMQLLTRELREALGGAARSVVILKLIGPLERAGGAGAAPAAPAN